MVGEAGREGGRSKVGRVGKSKRPRASERASERATRERGLARGETFSRLALFHSVNESPLFEVEVFPLD